MTELAIRILIVLVGLMPWSGDEKTSDRNESKAEREARLRPVAIELASAVGSVQLPPGMEEIDMAAAAVSLTYHETRLARYVLEDRCQDGPKGARCDDGKARGAYQLWEVSCKRAYAFPAGSRESLHEETRCAVSRLALSYRRCSGRHPGGPYAGMYSAYRGGGSGCTWEGNRLNGARARSRTAYSIRGKIIAVKLPSDEENDGEVKKVLDGWKRIGDN